MFERATATAKTAVWKFWISFGAFLYAVCNAVFVVATLPIALFCPAKRRSSAMSFCLRRLLHFMFITAASPLRFVGLSRVRGAELFRRKGAVFVCNHGTLLDPMYALALIPDAGVLLKNKYGKILAIWYLVKCFDFIEIGWASASDASVRAELSYVLERSKRLLAEGKNYLIFPEGSRSKSGRVGEFKSLAFKLAYERGCDVVAMCVVADSPFFSKDQKGLLPPRMASYTVEGIGVLKPSDYRNADALCAAAQRMIAKRVAEIRAEKSCASGRVGR